MQFFLSNDIKLFKLISKRYKYIFILNGLFIIIKPELAGYFFVASFEIPSLIVLTIIIHNIELLFDT